ncbi:hypothetical protein Dimus_024213 [Dionaea muscipula]
MSNWSMQCLSCYNYLYYKTGNAFYPTINKSVAGPCWTTGNGHYTTNGPGTCEECYVKARDKAVELETKNKKLGRENEELGRKNEELGREIEDLGREIEELKANVDFLRHSPPSSYDDPIQCHPRSSPLSTDVKLVASDDLPDAPIPANKFILVSC